MASIRFSATSFDEDGNHLEPWHITVPHLRFPNGDHFDIGPDYARQIDAEIGLHALREIGAIERLNTCQSVEEVIIMFDEIVGSPEKLYEVMTEHLQW